MSKIVFALVALVAMIGVVFGTAPLQLSGAVGENISANLTDDVAFHVGEDNAHFTSHVYVLSTQEGASWGGNGNTPYPSVYDPRTP